MKHLFSSVGEAIVEGRSRREEAEGSETSWRNRDVEDKSRESRKETRETQRQPDPQLQIRPWQERQSWADETPGSRFCGGRFGLCCAGRVAASSRVSSGDGEGETGLLQAGVPPLLPLQMQGLLLLTQSLPPSGSGPGRSCCFLESQDGGLLRFSLRRSHPLSHRWGN